jgi:hypothetical protein
MWIQPTMLNMSIKELGIEQVLLERLNAQILPLAFDIKKKVERGECLSDHELELLQRLVEDANRNIRLAGDHPELLLLTSLIARLYSELARRALENEEENVKSAYALCSDQNERQHQESTATTRRVELGAVLAKQILTEPGGERTRRSRATAPPTRSSVAIEAS